MDNDVIQGLILFISACSIYLISDAEATIRKWGAVAGIAAQPFWIITAIANDQWGILVLSLVYIYSFSRIFLSHKQGN